MSKCAYCGGNNFHTTFCEVPHIEQQQQANAKRMKGLRERAEAAEAANNEMRERLERIGKELRRIFVDVPMQGTLEGIKRQRDKQIRQIQKLLDREFPE